PLIAFCVLGAALHWRRAPRDSVFVWGGFAINVLVAGALINHNGAWAFGPRYLVQSVVPLAVVGATALGSAVSASASPRVRRLAWGAFAAMTLYGAAIEAVVSFYQPFTAQVVEAAFRSFPLPPAGESYFKNSTRAQRLV